MLLGATDRKLGLMEAAAGCIAEACKADGRCVLAKGLEELV